MFKPAQISNTICAVQGFIHPVSGRASFYNIHNKKQVVVNLTRRRTTIEY